MSNERSGDGSVSLSGWSVRELWATAHMEENLLDSERRVGAANGDNGCGSGADNEWTPDDVREYAKWSDEVNRQHELEAAGAIVCLGCGEATNGDTDWCGGNHCRMDDYDHELEAEEAYAAEELARMQALEDERRQDR